MKITLLLAAILLVLTSKVRCDESEDGPLLDALRGTTSDNADAVDDDDKGIEMNDLDKGGPNRKGLGDVRDDDSGSSESSESSVPVPVPGFPGINLGSLTVPGSSSNDLLTSIAPTVVLVVGVSILATIFLMVLMGYDFSFLSSMLSLPGSDFGTTGYPAPNYPYEDYQESYASPVILARRSYAVLTPVIEAISSAYKKYQGHKRSYD